MDCKKMHKSNEASSNKRPPYKRHKTKCKCTDQVQKYKGGRVMYLLLQGSDDDTFAAPFELMLWLS